uniref:Putative hemolymph juvenile hormone binding protein n=1 Tax=Panstrongylus lignarius TaxID=156445 RepID=A0A224XR31_9HEMI
MQYTNLILTLCLVLATSLVDSKRILPDYIPQCKKNDRNFDQCVIKAIDAIRPHLIKGIPKIRVPALEPLKIPQIAINRNLTNVKVFAKLTNIIATGGSNFTITKLRCNTDALTLEMSLFIPYIAVTCDYDVDGRLLVMPLKGKGVFMGNFTDITAVIKGVGEAVSNKKGVKYINIKTVKPKIDVGGQDTKFHTTDDDPNIKAITQTVATFINQNQRQVFEIVRQIVEETVGAVSKSMGNNIFSAIPLNEILPQ